MKQNLYSNNMASFFKRFKKNIPASTTSKGSTYYRRESIISNYGDLKSVLEAAPDIPASNTTEEITFNSLPLKSINFSEVKKKFGNPAYIHDNEHIEGHKVLFYKDSVAYYKFLIRAQSHFFLL